MCARKRIVVVTSMRVAKQFHTKPTKVCAVIWHPLALQRVRNRKLSQCKQESTVTTNSEVANENTKINAYLVDVDNIYKKYMCMI